MDDGPQTTVAWAIPVEAQSTGARLEAYAKSRAAIRTFKLCIQYASADQALANVPDEIFEMVATRIQQHIFDERRIWWQDAVRCCLLLCECGDHEDHRTRVESLMAKVGERSRNDEQKDFDKCKQVQNQQGYRG